MSRGTEYTQLLTAHIIKRWLKCKHKQKTNDDDDVLLSANYSIIRTVPCPLLQNVMSNSMKYMLKFTSLSLLCCCDQPFPAGNESVAVCPSVAFLCMYRPFVLQDSRMNTSTVHTGGQELHVVKMHTDAKKLGSVVWNNTHVADSFLIVSSCTLRHNSGLCWSG